ncbi:alpha/beta hydrolase [Pseudomonas hunanensis]|uniref:Alpha/beta hydrolase n=1 Tax=Pseudomonas hunanensis TaxID=1247546 RepID=A0ABD6MYA3_9PSED|nr:alpha/beta hydrolase [Pseudomonas hunanensis]NWL45115.1 alpha/beta hydrolase [Pseudomonas hunanensis]
MKSAELNEIHALLNARKSTPPGSLQEARKGYDQLCAMFQPHASLRFESLELGGVPALRGATANCPTVGNTILYVHGGGFMVGSAAGFKGLAGSLALHADAQVFVLDYRLAPEYPFPAGRDDVLRAYKALLAAGIPPQKIALAGDSAGAQLILSSLLEAKAQNVSLPGAILALSPWVDLTLSGGSLYSKADDDVFLSAAKLTGCAQAYFGAGNASDEASVVLTGDLQEFPPLMIHVGSAEILLDDALRLANHAISNNVMTRLEVWPDMFHVWHAFAPRLREGREALAQAGEFLKQHLQSH